MKNKLKNFKRFIRNAWRYRAVLAKDEDWDVEFLFDLMLKKLELMSKYFNSGKATVADAGKIVVQIDTTISRLQRLVDSGELDYYEAQAGVPEQKVVKGGDGAYTLEPAFTEEEMDALQEAMIKGKAEREHDKEFVLKMLLNESESWWD